MSLQIAAQPEGSQMALTERFIHKRTKHDITVDPNTDDPLATFKNHRKGQGGVGAAINIRLRADLLRHPLRKAVRHVEAVIAWTRTLPA